MSSEPVVEVRGLHKNFPVYDKPYHRLFQMFSRGRWYREFEALRNIEFSVGRGETVGIVGRNGSGKSTLLQLICGTLAPSSGEAKVHGRVAALLELGAGFNPDFTGRENAFMNGAVLGLSRAQVQERLESILEFAGIGEFIDRPVKTYSSGMYVRLAFAVAIHVEPDLLIVDEALAVGDEAFQRKCFARIDALRKRGCTVLFVSHAAATVIELCDRAILLDGGDMLADGAPKDVISRYQRLLYADAGQARVLRDQLLLARTGRRPLAGPVDSPVASGSVSAMPVQRNMEPYFDEGLLSQSTVAYANKGASIDDPHIQTLQGKRVNVINGGERYAYTYRVHFDQAAAGVHFGMLIKTLTGVELAGGVTARPEDAVAWVEAGSCYEVRFEFECRLAPGVYFMNAGVQGRLGEEQTFLDRRVDVVMFRVLARPERLATGWIDLVETTSAAPCEAVWKAHE